MMSTTAFESAVHFLAADFSSKLPKRKAQRRPCPLLDSPP